MKRVHLFQFEAYPEFTDGRTNRLDTIARHLSEVGYDVVLHSLGRHSEEFERENVTYMKIGFPGMTLGDGGSKKTAPPSRLLKKLANSLFFPDRYVVVLPLIYLHLKSKIKENEVLVITIPWFSACIITLFPFLVGLKVKVFIDYRDLWTNNKIFTGNALSVVISKWIEKKALKRAFLVTSTTPNSKQYLDGAYNIDSLIVSNGVSRVEYTEMCRHSLVNRSGFFVRLIYMGNMGNKRNCTNLLRAIRKVGVTFSIYGNLDHEHAAIAKKHYKGSVDRKLALELTSQSESVLVVIRFEENSSYAIPGKIYEAVALNKPILLYCPISAVAKTFLSDIKHAYYHIDSEDDSLCLTSELKLFLEFLSETSLEMPERIKFPIREDEINKIIPYMNS